MRLINNIDRFNTIKVNDKLKITNGILIIEKKNYFRPISRFLSGMNREKIYLFIFLMINEINIELERFRIFKTKRSHFRLEEINIRTVDEYFRVFNKLEKMTSSINKLKETYKKDNTYRRKLDLLKLKLLESNPDYKRLITSEIR